MIDESMAVFIGSGNAFLDSGFPPEEAEELLVRSRCMSRIGKIKLERGWTQRQLGEAMGMPQSEVSLLVNGHIERFSLERLLRALRSLGVSVHITLEASSDPHLTLEDRLPEVSASPPSFKAPKARAVRRTKAQQK